MLIKYKTEPTIIVLSPNSANLIKILTQFVYSINIRYFSPSSPVFCAAKYRGGVRRTEGLIKQRGLEYKQEHNPRFRLYRAAKTQGRRREKGEDCLSGASSADPDGDRSDKPKGPITAAAFLCSFFSLLRRMNKESELV